jgi:hypothetical protein
LAILAKATMYLSTSLFVGELFISLLDNTH